MERNFRLEVLLGAIDKISAPLKTITKKHKYGYGSVKIRKRTIMRARKAPLNTIKF